MILRQYQQDAVDSVYRYLREHDDNPCVVIPTAGGKTPVMATICKDAVGQWSGRVLIVAHVKELLEQAADKLQAVCPEVCFGVYSAGLGSRDTLAPVIIAGVQSVFRRSGELGHFDLVLIDEAHMIPPDGDGMYRTLLAGLRQSNPALRVIGLTATPFRMSSGPICAPDNILNAICYEVGVRELINQEYLCPLKSKAGREKVDTDSLHVRCGEFIAGEVEALMDDDRLVRSACREIVEQTRDRKSVLIFASGVKHGEHIRETIEQLGHGCRSVFGDTLEFDRSETLEHFKSGKLKYLVNVNVLTTGFDAPSIDCVALLRPTLSPGLYYQMVGRGFRLHPGKQNCLVLDFGGNVMRHGPIDAIRVRERGDNSGPAPVKECPNCQHIISAGYTICPECGIELPRQAAKHDGAASDASVLSGEVTDRQYPVLETRYSVHVKRNAAPDAARTLRVDYRIGFSRWQSEWICFEHLGFARRKSERWWSTRSDARVPDTAAEAVALAEAGVLCQTKGITVRSVSGEQYDSIINHDLGDKPAVTDALAAPQPAETEPEYVPADDDVAPF